jgi:hypothetical protein
MPRREVCEDKGWAVRRDCWGRGKRGEGFLGGRRLHVGSQLRAAMTKGGR